MPTKSSDRPIKAAAAPALSSKKVLITGGLGFIGSSLAHRCVELGAVVTIYDCLDPKSGGNMFNLHGIRDAVQIVLNDVRNFEGVCTAILNQDIVFHCAAYTSHPDSMREPLIDIDVNCKGTINVLEAARRFNPSVTVVHVGTSTQVGPMLRRKIDEVHPEFPLDIYSANKSVSEKYALIYHSAYKLRTTVVRLVNVFGPRASIVTPDVGFINYFVGLALRKRPITVYGKGRQLRSVNYIDDVTEALLLAATNAKSVGRVFFVSGDRPHSVAAIARTIARVVGGTVAFVDWPQERRDIEVGDAVVSYRKMKTILGWQPHFDLRAGLVATRGYFVQHLRHYV